MIEPSTALVLARFVFDIAALFLWGAGLFAWLLAPGPLGKETWQRLAVARNVAVLAIVGAVLLMLPTRAAGLGNGWLSALDSGLVWLMLWNTSIGSSWLVQARISLVLLGLVAVNMGGPARTATLAGLLLLSTVLTGHAAMSAGWLKMAHQANSAVHVLSAGAWVGALVPLLVVMANLKDANSQNVRKALMSFSTMGHVAVIAVVLTGFASAFLILERLPLPPQSTYEILLWLKIAVIVAMVSLAIINRYIFVPRLRSWVGAKKALIGGTWAEIALTMVAVALVAWFGTLSPMPLQ